MGDNEGRSVMADANREAQFTREFFSPLKTIEASIGTRSRLRRMMTKYDNNVVEAWKNLKNEITYGFFELKQHGLLAYSSDATSLTGKTAKKRRMPLQRLTRKAIGSPTLMKITFYAERRRSTPTDLLRHQLAATGRRRRSPSLASLRGGPVLLKA
jgi:hypothetical protein